MLIFLERPVSTPWIRYRQSGRSWSIKEVHSTVLENALTSLAGGLSCQHQLRYYRDSGTSIALSEIHPHWLYNWSREPEAAGIIYSREPAVRQQWKAANKVSHKKGYGKKSKRRDLMWPERVQWTEWRILGVAKAPQDQHTVYTTGAGSVVGSGSAAPPKRLSIRTPDCSLRKPKRLRATSQVVDDFLDGWIDIDIERVDLTKDAA